MYDSATRQRSHVRGLTLSETSRATEISRSTLRTWLLHDGHPTPNATGLIDACERTLTEVLPTNRVCRVACPGCTSVVGYSKHRPCLFPQAGPGPEHLRPIVLADWRRTIVAEHLRELVRGLIHSDGCGFTNRATGRGRRYAYPRCVFTNKSDDIRRIFTDALDEVGVEWKVTKRGSSPYNISLARRASVALMDEHVGPKH